MSSATTPAFQNPHHFTYVKRDSRSPRRAGWYCNLCATSPPKNEYLMSATAAISHEKQSNEHKRNVAGPQIGQWWLTKPEVSSWDPEPAVAPKSLADLKALDSYGYDSCSSHLIPFWRDALLAAEKGEELKLEYFMEQERKRDRESGWSSGGGPVGGAEQWTYEPGDWGRKKSSSISSRSLNHVRTPASLSRKSSGRFGEGNIVCDCKEEHVFVESIASLCAASTERKKRMHTFFHMSTGEKVKRIEELVRYLHDHS